MNEPVLVPTRPLWKRALLLLDTAALSFAVSILLTIVLLAKVPMMRDVVFAITPVNNVWGVYFTYFAMLVVFAAPLAVLAYGLRYRWLSWRVLPAIWALILGTVVYLAWDEPVVNLPANLDEIAPIFPGDAASYQISLRFSKNPPDVKLDEKAAMLVRNLSGNAADVAILQQHHDEIEAGWNAISPLRQWWADLAALPRIGDLYRNLDDPILPFSPIRTYTRFACAHAELLALDGQGDEALATLGQIVDVAQKFSATSRTLVRYMISIVIEKTALARANFVLDHAQTTPAARAEFAATLASGLSAESGARRMMMVEYVVIVVPLFLEHRQSLGEMLNHDTDNQNIWRGPLDLLEPLLINPRGTVNLAGSYYNDLADLAAKRDFAGMSALVSKFEVELNDRAPIKNIGGRFILSQALPAFPKVAEQYWQMQDVRSALLARLKAMH